MKQVVRWLPVQRYDPNSPAPTFATHIVDVEVDPETGKVQILRYTAVQDAGKAIYPDYVAEPNAGRSCPGCGLGFK